MKSRCYNVNNPDYKTYGARGIIMYYEWYFNYIKFKAWALANGYRKDLTIDRIDNNGDYAPWNCRFISIALNIARRNQHHANITMGEAEEIRKIFYIGKFSQSAIARVYGMSSKYIWAIVRFKKFKETLC